MSNKKVLIWELIGIVFIVLLGTLWHELYNLSGNNFLVGLIAPVNESHWEHWKIGFFPIIIYAAIEYFFIKNTANNYIFGKDKVNNFIFAKAISVIVLEVVTFGLILLWNKFFGEGGFLLHIIAFILGAAAAQITSYLIITRTESSEKHWLIGILILALHLLLFVVFTLNPPRIPYFQDGKTGTYGIYEYK